MSEQDANQERWEEYKARKDASRRRRRSILALLAPILLSAGLLLRYGPLLAERWRGAAPRTGPTVEATTAPRATRAPVVRSLDLLSDPAGAELFYRGRSWGVTPRSLKLPSGASGEIFLLRPGRRVGRIRLQPGGPDRHSVKLPARGPWLPWGGWSGQRGGPERGGYGPELQPPLKTGWTVQIEETPVEGIAVQGERILASTGRKDLTALDLTTGRVLWDLEGTGAYGSPTTDDRFAYVVGKNAQLRAVDLEKGKVRGRHALTSSVLAPLTLREDRLIVCTPSGKILCLELRRKRRKVRFSFAWETDVGRRIEVAPLEKDGALYVATEGSVSALDTEDGRPLWTAETRQDGSSVPGAVRLVDGAPGAVSPVWSTAGLLVGAGEGGLLCLEPRTGATKWAQSLDGSGLSGAVVAEGDLIHATTRAGGVFTLLADTGAQIWYHDTEQALECAPAMTPGWILLGTREGHVIALDRWSGRRLWTHEGDSPISAGPVLLPNRILVGFHDGKLRVFVDSGAGRTDHAG